MPVKTISPSKRARPLKTRRQPKSRAPKRSSGAPSLSAKGYVRAIQNALSEGAYRQATELSVEGARKYPKHTLLDRYVRALAPPRVYRYEHAPDKSIASDKAWIKQNAEQYRGKWIALRTGEFLGASDSLQELTDAHGISRDILYTKVF